MDSMYEVLMQLPLFKGVSYDCISNIITSTPFHFLKYPQGEVIVQPEEPCTHIKFVISGSVRMTTTNDDGRFKLQQTLKAPDVLSPQYLFGHHTYYPALVTAREATGILQLAKQDYIKLLQSDEVFLYNYMNILCMSAQKAMGGMLKLTHGAMEDRLAFWVINLTQPSSLDVAITSKLRDLYSIFGVQRTTFMTALDTMKDMGLVEYDQSGIRFINRKGLIDLLVSRYN